MQGMKKKKRRDMNSMVICAGKGENSQTKQKRKKKVEKRNKRKNKSYRIGVQKMAVIDRSTLLGGRENEICT